MHSVNVRVTVTGVYGSPTISTSSENGVPGNECKTSKEVEALRDEVHSRIRQAKREIDEQLDALLAKVRPNDNDL